MGTLANIAVLPQESDTLRIEAVELADPGAHQVLVKTFASGICHSQLHEIHNPRDNPVVLGHESTGVIVKAGSDVTHVQEGDIVIVTWVLRDAQQSGRVPGHVAVPVSDGIAVAKEVYTWADHSLVDEQFVVKVRPDTNRDVTSIIGCAVMTGAGAVVNTADVQPGQSVAIIGVGGIGLSAVAAAKVAGAAPIIAVDLDDDKLEFARKFGATHTINAGEENPVRAIRALTKQTTGFTYMEAPVSGADFVLDCIGHEATMQQAVAACRRGQFGTRKGGTAIYVGLPQGKLELNPMDILVSEKNIQGSYCGSCVPDRDIPEFLDWYSNGKLDLEALVTARYRLEDINEAVAALAAGKIFGRAIIEF